jgi:predicted aspartyl protease
MQAPIGRDGRAGTSAGQAKAHGIVRLLGFALAALALPAAHAGSPSGACALAALPATELLVRLPFETVDGRVYVPVRVNGRGPFRFAVDTGASGTGRLDASVVSTLGLPPVGKDESSDGVRAQVVDTTRLDSLALGGLVRSGVVLITRDYRSRMAPRAWFAGILGRDFFADGLLVIDYPGRTLSFTRSHGLSPGEPGVIGYQRPFRIPASIGTVQVEANVDTGADVALVLPQALYPRVEASGLVQGPQGRLTNTVIQTRRTRVKGPVRIGGIALSDVDALVSERLPEVVVGSRILSRSVLVIDQRSRLIALCPGR